MNTLAEGALNILVNSALNQFEKNNPNPTKIQQEYIRILRNRDAENGIPTATNLCSTMGETKEEALNKAARYFNI